MSQAEERLALQLRLAGYADYEREYRFMSDRRFRFDFAFPPERIALEVEGGLYVAGRHIRPQGYQADLEKYNLAAILGWKVIRVSPAMVDDGRALRYYEMAHGEAWAG